MKPLVNAAIAETIVITYRDVKDAKNIDNPIPHFPLPSQYVSVAIVYGALSFFPEKASNVAGLIGWGFVLATVLNLWTPGQKVSTSSALATTINPNGGAQGTYGPPSPA